MGNLKFTSLAIVIIMISSCRKDPAVIPTPQQEDTLDAPTYLLDPSSKWTYRHFWGDGNPAPGMEIVADDTISYFFDGDTVLERFTKWDYDDVSITSEPKTYMRLRFEKKSTQLSPVSDVIYSSGVVAYLRVDSATSKIFITHGDQNVIANLDLTHEAILYDFSLNIGDTLPYNYWNGGVSNDYVIEEVEYLTFGSISIKVMKAYSNQIYYHGTIYEGIGGLEGIERRYSGWGDELIHFENADFSYNP